MVASAAQHDAGVSPPGLRSSRHPASSEQADAAAAHAYLETGGIQAVRQVLEQQGFYPKTIDRIVQRWEAQKAQSTLNRHRRFWDNTFVSWCRSQRRKPYKYNAVLVTNFLSHIQDTYEQQHRERGVQPNHSMFKQARAAIGAMLALIHPGKPPIAEFGHIAGIAQTLRVTAPNLPKYSETISLDPLFEVLIEAARRGAELTSIPLKTLRDWTLVLVRIRLGSRSADVACINRIWSDDPTQSAVAGLQGSHDNGVFIVKRVRYDFPKSWRSRVRMSAWKSLGNYLSEQQGFSDDLRLCCPRRALEEYLRRTSECAFSSFVDPERPGESLPRVFLSVTTRHGMCFPIISSTIGSLIKKILAEVGIDTSKFKAHILRSASIGTAVRGGEAIDSALDRAQVSAKVFSIYYDLPVAESTRGASSASAGVASTLASSAAFPAAASQVGPAQAAPSNHADSSGAFSRRSLRLMDAG